MSTTETARDELAAGFEGQVIGREDSEYDEARAVFNAMIDKRPLLIARCAGADDVARTIAFARRHDVPLAVRGGGHNGAGLGSVDDGVVVDLSPMRTVVGRRRRPHGPRRRRLHLGRRRPGHATSTASPFRAASSPPPASAVSRSAAASATSPAGTG